MYKPIWPSLSRKSTSHRAGRLQHRRNDRVNSNPSRSDILSTLPLCFSMYDMYLPPDRLPISRWTRTQNGVNSSTFTALGDLLIGYPESLHLSSYPEWLTRAATPSRYPE